eukprot:11162478-Lingulodinium_polyedra.AAC.1
MFELEIDENQVLGRKTEKFLRPRPPYFQGGLLLTSLKIEQGGRRSPEWDPSLEFSPQRADVSAGRFSAAASRAGHQL